MRLIIVCLTALLILIQYPLWLGKGGWLRVSELGRQVEQAQKKNEELKERNAKLASEVQDLQQGTGAVEERARYEMGMIKKNEIFVQVLDPHTSAGNSLPPPVPSAAQTPTVPTPANTPGKPAGQ